MDESEIARTATQALESAKSAHKRLDGLEKEVGDIRNLTAAMARIDEKVDGLESNVQEIKSDVKMISGRHGKWWDDLIAGMVGAIGAGTAAAVITSILK